MVLYRLTLTRLPCRSTVDQTATLRRTVRGWHRFATGRARTRRQTSGSTSFEKATALTVGCLMLIVHDCGAEWATLPLTSRALFALWHVTVWDPTPETGM